MSLKRSQNYLYFQNKAHHYQNIQTARPRIQSSLPGSLKRSLDHSNSHHNRDMPYNKRYQIQYENRNLANRILSISHATKKQVDKQGSYSRFHKFQRDFRSRNPYKEEEMRNITLENDKILKHIDRMKPRVGDNDQWQTEYRSKSTYRKLLCKYDDALKSKEELLLPKEAFLPDPYLKFIEQLSPSSSDKKLPFSQGQSSQRLRHVRIQKQKLFILPSFSPIETPILQKDTKKPQQQISK